MTVDETIKQAAKNVNLRNFLASQYPDEIKFDTKTKQYRNPIHDSLVISEHAWYRFSTGEGGDTIQYLMVMHNKSFQEAAIELAEYAGVNPEYWQTPRIKNSEYEPPKPARLSSQKTLEYLRGRAISDETIQMLLQKNLVYTDERHNIVFKCNVFGNEIFVIKGTSSKAKFNQIITSVSNNYWYFKAGKNPCAIYICESPIDAISLYECNKKKPGIYTSMCGLKITTLKYIVRDLNPQGDIPVKIAVDWDKRGKEFYAKHKLDELYPFVGAGKYKEHTKDWNEVLQLLRR